MMLRKIVSVWMIIVSCFLSLAGCADNGQEAAPEAEQTKTAAEYKAEADKEITEENAAAELDKIEQAIEQEAVQEP